MIDDDDIVHCYHCEGAGYLSCRRCDGEGWTSTAHDAWAHGHYYVDYWEKECPDCEGTGVETCRHCGGTGLDTS